MTTAGPRDTLPTPRDTGDRERTPGVDHAFARTDGVNYDKAAAQQAEKRTLTSFKANLA